MDIKRDKTGQVIQQESLSQETDTNLTGDSHGEDLKLGFTIGRESTVTKLDDAYTEFTHHPGGPSPLHPNQK